MVPRLSAVLIAALTIVTVRAQQDVRFESDLELESQIREDQEKFNQMKSDVISIVGEEIVQTAEEDFLKQAGKESKNQYSSQIRDTFLAEESADDAKIIGEVFDQFQKAVTKIRKNHHPEEADALKDGVTQLKGQYMQMDNFFGLVRYFQKQTMSRSVIAYGKLVNVNDSMYDDSVSEKDYKQVWNMNIKQAKESLIEQSQRAFEIGDTLKAFFTKQILVENKFYTQITALDKKASDTSTKDSLKELFKLIKKGDVLVEVQESMYQDMQDNWFALENRLKEIDRITTQLIEQIETPNNFVGRKGVALLKAYYQGITDLSNAQLSNTEARREHFITNLKQ